jgi:predicted dehydrogenase
VGIGANGIHYIDLVKFLSGAAQIKVVSAGIDDETIPSGRGPQFGDFGGFAVMDYLAADGEKLARCHFILGSQSTVLGPWEIVGKHGRILIDEFEQTRFNKYRKADSELPIQRYAGDYLPIETEKFEVPFLNDLTEEWLTQLIKGNSILPEIKETLTVHRAMFDWLSHSKKFKIEFPIT